VKTVLLRRQLPNKIFTTTDSGNQFGIQRRIRTGFAVLQQFFHYNKVALSDHLRLFHSRDASGKEDQTDCSESFSHIKELFLQGDLS